MIRENECPSFDLSDLRMFIAITHITKRKYQGILISRQEGEKCGVAIPIFLAPDRQNIKWWVQ